MSSFTEQRRNMVDGQLRTFDVFDRAVLAAMNEVPRESFVPPGLEHLAYLDRNIVFGEGADSRVMLAPMVLGRLIQAVDVEPSSRVLDVGSGYGYSAAIFGKMGAKVTVLEPSEALADAARQNLGTLGIEPAGIRSGSLELGAKQDGPFDIILVNGGIETRPQALLDQLADGGRLACLVAGGSAGKANLYVRSGDAFGERRLFDSSAPVLEPFRKAPAFQF